MDAVDRASTTAAPSAASCATSADGDRVVCGLDGIRVTPEFRERDRDGFAFMTNEISSERRVEAGVARIAAMMREIKARGQTHRVRRRAGGRPHRRRRSISAELIRARLRRRAARRQRAGGARRRAGAVRHVARRRSRGRRAGARAATAITCARSTPSTAPAASARRSTSGVLTSGVMDECVRAGVDVRARRQHPRRRPARRHDHGHRRGAGPLRRGARRRRAW